MVRTMFEKIWDSHIVVASAKAYVNAINRLLAIGVQDRSASTGAV